MPENKVQITLEAINKFEGAFNQFGKSLKERLNDANNFKLKMTELDGFLKQGIGIGALYGFMREIKESINTAELLQNSLRGLASQARYAGEDIGESMDAATKLAGDGLLDVQKASQSLQNLLSRGFSLKESVDIINRLKDAAAFNRQASLSMGQAVQSATEGLKNENSILVDNAGVTKNVSIMWKEYAAQIGKGVDGLTQAEKRQAEYNGILRETQGHTGNAKLAAQGLTGEKARLSVEVFKLKAALGDGLTPAFIAIGKAILWAMGYVKMFLGGIEILGAKTAMTVQKLEAVRGWFASGFKGGASALKAELASLQKIYDEQAMEIVNKWEGKIEAPDIGKDSGKRQEDLPVVPTDTTVKTSGKTENLLASWRETARDLATDLSQLNADEFTKKIAEYENKAADMMEKFKSVKGAAEEIGKWLAGMKGNELSKYEKQAKEESLKATTEAAKERASVIESSEKFITERTKTELEKRIADEEKSAQDQIGKLAGKLAARNILEEEYDTRSNAIREASKRRQLEITEDYNRQILEAETSHALALLNAAEKDMSIPKEDVTRGRIAAQTTLLNLYNAELQKSIENNDTLARIGWQEKIDATNASITEQNELLREQTGTFQQGLIEAIKEYAYNMETAFQFGKQSLTDLANSMEGSFQSAFAGIRKGTFDLRETLLNFLDDVSAGVEKMLSKMLTNWIMTGDAMKSADSGGKMGGLMGLFGSIFGSIFSGGGDAMSSQTGVNYMGGSWDILTNFAKGGSFSALGLKPYLNTVVSKPTVFKFAHGIGMMGEEGDEAIMPLARTASGNLGVRAVGAGGSQGNVTVNNFHITTMDSKSLDEYVRRNDAVFAASFTRSINSSPGGVRKAIKRTR